MEYFDATIDFALEKTKIQPDLTEQAATLLRIIAAEHPFVDGNKRTALASAELLLNLNGYYIEIKDYEETIEFIKLQERSSIYSRIDSEFHANIHNMQ
ncbi:MAG: type II toxin-antitoxin system death-on-curing family toxin [Nitrososphaerales archaeon]